MCVLLTLFIGPRRTLMIKMRNVIGTIQRPAPLPGYKRITWQSAYGKSLYIDVQETCPGGAENLQSRFRKSVTMASGTGSGSSALLTLDEPRRPALAYVPANLNSPSSSMNPHNPLRSQESLVTMDSQSTLTESNQRQRDRRYLLLCFSTRKSKSFRQIDMTDLANDQYLFRRIHDAYWEIRPKESWISRVRSLPFWIHWCFDGVHFFKAKRADFVSVSPQDILTTAI